MTNRSVKEMMTAARAEIGNLSHVDNGINGWQDVGLPVE